MVSCPAPFLLSISVFIFYFFHFYGFSQCFDPPSVLWPAFSALTRLQCFDPPSVLWRCWSGVRKGIRPVKILRCWCGYLLERSANSFHMVQLMPLPPHYVGFSKIQNGLSFWYRLTRVVPDKGRKTVVVNEWMNEWYDYFNVRSKADRCQLNLPHRTKN